MNTAKKYDFISIGAGSSGIYTGLALHTLGLKVLIIDKTDFNIGGDCLNFGCVPSKALIHISKMAHQAREAQQFGLEISGEIDLQKVMEHVQTRQNVIRAHENAQYFQDKGLDVVLGIAKFADKNTVEVNGEFFTAKRILIATGSSPRVLPIKGLEKVKHFTNESIWDLRNLPKNLLAIGAGAIGVELGQAFARLGTKVTIVDVATRPLMNEEESISEILKARLEKEGIQFHFETTIKEFLDEKTAVLQKKDGSEIHLEMDAVLMAVGRKVNIEGLNLEKAGIQTENRKIKINSKLRTSNKKVFVCGDVAGQLMFSHGAALHANVLLNNFIIPFKKKVNYDQFSWTTFTSPQVATFGLSEKTLKERNISFEKMELNFHDDDRAVVDSYDDYGKLILYIKKGLFKKRILGGTMIAPNAGELIQELILAQNTKMNTKKIFDKVYPYPTASRVNQQVFVNEFLEKTAPKLRGLAQFLYRF